MFRFTIRDLLWLTVLLGLSFIWWQEHQHRQTTLRSLNRFQVVADEPALCGMWEIVAETSGGKIHDLGGQPRGFIDFDGTYCREARSLDGPYVDAEYKIVRPSEMEISVLMATGKAPPQKWRYQLQGGELRVIRSSRPGERPKDFDAISDPALTLYELKRKDSQTEETVRSPPENKPVPPKGGIDI